MKRVVKFVLQFDNPGHRNSVMNDIDAHLTGKPIHSRSKSEGKDEDNKDEASDFVKFTDDGEAIKFFHSIKGLNQGGRKNRGNKRFTGLASMHYCPDEVEFKDWKGCRLDSRAEYREFVWQ